MVVKILGHVELEARRLRMHDAAARMHAIDLLADAHGVVDAEKLERVLVGDEQEVGIIHTGKSLYSGRSQMTSRRPARTWGRMAATIAFFRWQIGKYLVSNKKIGFVLPLYNQK